MSQRSACLCTRCTRANAFPGRFIYFWKFQMDRSKEMSTWRRGVSKNLKNVPMAFMYAWSHTKNVASHIRNVKGGTMQFSVICFYTIFKILLTFLNNSWQRKNKSPVRYIRSSHSWTTHFQWQSRVIYSHTLCTWDHNSTYCVACIHWKINDFLHIISKGSSRIFPLM